MIHLNYPFDPEQIRSLKIGDIVLIQGTIYTGRDAVHKFLFEGNASPVSLKNQVIYHCGPVIINDGKGEYKVVAAGPTTSSREEPYQGKVIEDHGIIGIIGKGGMGPMSLAACRKHGTVYFHAIGGTAQVLARAITKVPRVFLLEKFGPTEAIWEFQVKDFPAIVTIDAHGNSLQESVLRRSGQKLNEVLARHFQGD